METPPLLAPIERNVQLNGMGKVHCRIHRSAAQLKQKRPMLNPT
jgi:hypothetical protein